jgi:hypothetical protein
LIVATPAALLLFTSVILKVFPSEKICVFCVGIYRYFDLCADPVEGWTKCAGLADHFRLGCTLVIGITFCCLVFLVDIKKLFKIED